MDRTCPVCGTEFVAKRAASVYCKPACKKRAFDQRAAQRAEQAKPQVSTSPKRPERSTDLTDRITAELEGAGRLDSVAGQQALLLARRLEDPDTSFGSAAASLSKELREVMAEAMAGVAQADDPAQAVQDELKKRRERRQFA